MSDFNPIHAAEDAYASGTTPPDTRFGEDMAKAVIKAISEVANHYRLSMSDTADFIAAFEQTDACLFTDADDRADQQIAFDRAIVAASRHFRAHKTANDIARAACGLGVQS